MSDEWWFRSLGEEFGPVRFTDLTNAARRGMLSPADSVRHGERGVWRRAESIVGIAFGDACREHQAREWLVQFADGRTVGPLSVVELATMARASELKPADRIRRVRAIEGTDGRIRDRRSPDAENLPGDQWPAAPTKGALPASDVLEQIVLSVLGAPEDRPKPSMEELGLAGNAEDSQAVALVLPDREAATDDSAALRSSQPEVRWSRLNPFRTTAPPETGRTEDRDGSAIAILPPVERTHPDEAVEVNPAARQRTAAWIEVLWLFFGLMLVFQLLPSAFRPIQAYVDPRRWTWGTWLLTEVAAIVVLGSIAIWQRRS